MINLDLRVPRKKDSHSTCTEQIPHITTPSATASTKEIPKITRQHSHRGINFDLSEEGSQKRTPIGRKILLPTPVTGASFPLYRLTKTTSEKQQVTQRHTLPGGFSK